MNSEDILIKECQNGNLSSFEELISLYEGKVYGLCIRVLRNEQDALDVSQEVFIKVFKSIKTFKGNSSFSTWIYRIGYNACLDFIKKNKNNNVVPLHKNEDEDSKEIEIEDNTYFPENLIIKNEEKTMLYKAIDTLPENFKKIIILRDINGFSYEEIAEMENINIGTVKSRISRARVCLKEIILKEGGMLYELP